jgi:hypothetical protein
MLEIDIVIPYAPTVKIVKGHSGKPKLSLQLSLFQVYDIFELRGPSVGKKGVKGDAYSTDQNDGKLHQVILVGVGMEENAMGWNFSSRHTPLVLVAKCLAVRFQDHMPTKAVSNGSHIRNDKPEGCPKCFDCP